MNNENRPIWKRIFAFIIPIVGLIFVLQSMISLYSLWRKGDVVGEQEKKLHSLEEKQVRLKNELSHTYTYAYIEEQARNKLGLVKPGETIVYIEKNPKEEKLLQKTDGTRTNERIFHQWLELFFSPGG